MTLYLSVKSISSGETAAQDVLAVLMAPDQTVLKATKCHNSCNSKI